VLSLRRRQCLDTCVLARCLHGGLIPHQILRCSYPTLLRTFPPPEKSTHHRGPRRRSQPRLYIDIDGIYPLRRSLKISKTGCRSEHHFPKPDLSYDESSHSTIKLSELYATQDQMRQTTTKLLDMHQDRRDLHNSPTSTPAKRSYCQSHQVLE
jgi:hypothetical protein